MAPPIDRQSAIKKGFEVSEFGPARIGVSRSIAGRGGNQLRATRVCSATSADSSRKRQTKPKRAPNG
jgi:hypothetical protein